MKRALKYVLMALCILFGCTVAFYFWGSAPLHPETEYSKVTAHTWPTPSGGSADTAYRIVTYNIGYLSGMLNNLPVHIPESLHNANLQLARTKFAEINAAILCFQEIDYASKRSFYINQQDTIAQLGYPFVFQAVNWDKRYVPFPYFPISTHYGAIYSGQSVLSKYPIKDAERIVLEKVESDPFYRTAFYLDRLAQLCTVEIGGRNLILINVHLEAFDVETQKRQCAYVATLYNKYKDDYPVLLAGDFNSDAENRNAAVRDIFALDDIAAACQGLGEKARTFPSDHPVERIDYIFYNKRFITAIRSEVLTSFARCSDHLPVMLEFSLK